MPCINPKTKAEIKPVFIIPDEKQIQRIKMFQDLGISLAKKSLNSGCGRVHIAAG